MVQWTEYASRVRLGNIQMTLPVAKVCVWKSGLSTGSEICIGVRGWTVRKDLVGM